MPRKPRELVKEGIYHLFNRGNDRRSLFKEAADFHHFLGLVLQAAKKHPSEIFHYCLTPYTSAKPIPHHKLVNES